MLRISGPDALGTGASGDLELVTLAQLKTQLDRSSLGSGDDTTLQQLLNNAHRFVYSYLGERFLKATGTSHVYYLDGSGSSYLPLPQYPAVAVASVIEGYVSEAPSTFTTVRTIPTTEYYVDLDNGMIVSRYGAWSGGRDTYKVTWTSGYTTTPEDIAEAIAQWIGVKLSRLKDRRWDKLTQSDSDNSASFTTGDMPAYTSQVLRKYQRPEVYLG